MGGRRGRI
jgi:hypothetical protein